MRFWDRSSLKSVSTAFPRILADLACRLDNDGDDPMRVLVVTLLLTMLGWIAVAGDVSIPFREEDISWKESLAASL